jgi:hypothetical protein
VSIGRIRGCSRGSSEITVIAILAAVIIVQTIVVPITRFIIARENRLAVAMSGKATATGTDYYAVALHCSHRLSPENVMCSLRGAQAFGQFGQFVRIESKMHHRRSFAGDNHLVAQAGLSSEIAPEQLTVIGVV